MKKIRAAQLFALASLMTLAAAARAQDRPDQQQNRQIILRLHGSSTIGAALAPDLAKAFLQKMGADSVRQTDVSAGTEIDIEGYFAADKQTKVIEIRAHGSSTGFKGLQEGQCDIAMSSRKIKASEAETLASLGDMTSSTSEHVLGIDGVAVIVNAGNAAVSKLSFAALGDIFSGKITSWSEVSWNDAPVSIQARDENSGTHDTFKSIVLGKKELSKTASRFDSNLKLSEAVSADAHAIGYCSLPYVRNNKALAVSDSGAAVLPTLFTVATEDYPLSRRLYLYAPAHSENRWIEEFISFALEDKAGQLLVKKHNFVDLIVSAAAHRVNIAPGSTQNMERLGHYLAKVRGAKRLSANLRFKGETFELDNKALQDLKRIAAFLHENKTQEIMLAGFSDRSGEGQIGLGDSDADAERSCKQAEAVRNELAVHDVSVSEVLCVGSEVPVASNMTQTGREKNRRVEVWIR